MKHSPLWALRGALIDNHDVLRFIIQGGKGNGHFRFREGMAGSGEDRESSLRTMAQITPFQPQSESQPMQHLASSQGTFGIKPRNMQGLSLEEPVNVTFWLGDSSATIWLNSELSNSVNCLMALHRSKVFVGWVWHL